MPRLSTLSNPTGLVEIDRKRISLVIDDVGGQLSFSLVRLDLAGLKLPSPLDVVVMARKGNSEERVELGSVASWNKGFHGLTELGTEGSLSFRVLLMQPGVPKLAAAAENVRPEGQGDSSSLIALEPADLQELTWEMEVLEQEGRAVIRFNKEIYASAAEAESDRFFIGLVLPQAARHLAEWVAKTPAVLADTAWEPFKLWLAMHGITEEPDPESAELQIEWCRSVVAAFCNRFKFASELRELRMKGVDE